MKKWPIVLISLMIAIGVVAYGVSWRLSAMDFSEDLSASDSLSLSSTVDNKEIPSVTPSAIAVTSAPAAVSSSTPSPTVKPSVSPVPTVEPSSSPVPETTAIPSMTPIPVSSSSSPEELLSAITSSSFQETKDETTYSDAPVIFIEGGTVPEVLTVNNVVNITGKITCSPGRLEYIKAEITDGDKVSQSCSYSPFLDTFSLNGTVNADLHFARLGVGEYVYRIVATAANGDSVSTFTLIEESFSVVAAGSAVAAESGSTAGKYVAKQSDGTSTSDLIWNFLIGQFDNPYAAAGIMANMEAESSLNPAASQGSTPECGYGLCQWTQTRKQNLKDFAYIVSTDISDLDLQLCFLMYELEYDYPKLKTFLMNVSDGYLAASEFYAIYEQAASPGNRCSLAQKYLDKYAVSN